MFEHAGLARLPGYLSAVRRVLRPGGLFLNHGIRHDEEGWNKTVGSEFINNQVFPDGELDLVSNIQLGMERAGFEIHDVEGLRPHYALTLRHWVQRLEAHRRCARWASLPIGSGVFTWRRARWNSSRVARASTRSSHPRATKESGRCLCYVATSTLERQ